MSGATEIYICRPGQSLKEGRVEYGSMETRNEAESDAERRLKTDPSIAKIAYYAVKPNGDFRCIFTKNNPNAASVKPKRLAMDDVGPRKRRPPRPVKKSLMRRILALFESR